MGASGHWLHGIWQKGAVALLVNSCVRRTNDFQWGCWGFNFKLAEEPSDVACWIISLASSSFCCIIVLREIQENRPYAFASPNWCHVPDSTVEDRSRGKGGQRRSKEVKAARRATPVKSTSSTTKRGSWVSHVGCLWLEHRVSYHYSSLGESVFSALSKAVSIMLFLLYKEC